MKHPLLIALAALAALTPVRSSARDFSYDYEGQTITYTVLDEDAKTVETKQGEIIYASSGNNVSGNLALPAHPMDGDVEYTLTTIGEYAFWKCSALTSVEIPNSVTTIGSSAFSDCKFLTSMEISNSVTTIGRRAFYGCSSLTSVEIPNSVTAIGERAFEGCSSLTSVEIPNSVTTVENYAFQGCSSLTSVEIPNSVTAIGNSAFSNCKNLIEINVDSENQYYSSEDGVLFNKIKSDLIQYPAGKEGSYNIPNTVTAIGIYAFNGCSALTSIEIPNSVTTIGEGVFKSCKSLTSVEIPNSVTTIGTSAFGYCSALTSIEIPNSVITIGIYAFSDCTSLTSVEIPNSVTTIGGSAFYNCCALTSVEIPNSVTDIGDVAFRYCYALTEINVDSGNQYYSSEDGVLFNKDKTILVFFPEGKEGSYSIPNSVLAIGEWAFLACNLTHLQIPNSITMIGQFAFFQSNLTHLQIPNSITTIGQCAFYRSNLTNVEIPNSITTIESRAFGFCSALTSVTCLATVPPTLPNGAFEKNEDSYLYVPAASVSAYENSDWAQYFTGIKAINNPTGVDEVGAPDSGVRVSVWQNTVTITGLEPGTQVSVYDVAGNMVYAGNEHSLTLSAGQAYIVLTPSKTFKVVL